MLPFRRVRLAGPENVLVVASPEEAGLTLCPTTPQLVGERRYQSPRTAAPLAHRSIQAGTKSCSSSQDRRLVLEDGTLVPDWFTTTHPLDGNVYFLMDSSTLPLVTPTDVQNPDMLRAVFAFYDFFRSQCKVKLEPSRHELLLEVDPEDSRMCHCYILDHHDASVLWHRDLAAEETADLCFRQSASDNHAQTLLNIFYAEHAQLFSHRPLPGHVEQAIHIQAAGFLPDIQTNDESKSPFKTETLRSFIEFDNNTRKIKTHDGSLLIPRRTAIFARFWQGLLTETFEDRHGERSPRYGRTWSLQEPGTRLGNSSRGYKQYAVELFCLGIPSRFVKDIDATYVDELVWGEHWQKYLDKLKENWSNISLIATVLLTANVGFLAIPSVAESRGDRADILHYASVTSVVFSFASMATGRLLYRFHPDDTVGVSSIK
ncbi:hypothetical protein BKA62DRAFT_719004 [Auriculariales sp. MPI-PUGE-AT-0066]|nr:hypothetical protein BKA62DRAFT_719004 [Auriculariales sp. MPI-PUGE-AT-0066]